MLITFFSNSEVGDHAKHALGQRRLEEPPLAFRHISARQATPLRARAAFSGLLPGRLLKFFLEAALNIIHLERPLLIAAQYLVSILLE